MIDDFDFDTAWTLSGSLTTRYAAALAVLLASRFPVDPQDCERESLLLVEATGLTISLRHDADLVARTDAAQHLIAVIQDMPVDESFRQELLNSLPWHYRPSD
ncbi:MAG: hypothetical protein ACYCT0_09915 [Sulfobacillus sp.]